MELTTQFYESPKKQQNEDKFGYMSEPQCICCMRPIKNIEAAFTIHMNENWEVVHPSINENECEEKTGFKSQGSFDVGPECAKKMKGFVTKN